MRVWIYWAGSIGAGAPPGGPVVRRDYQRTNNEAEQLLEYLMITHGSCVRAHNSFFMGGPLALVSGAFGLSAGIE